VEHVVFWPGPDGRQSFERTPSLDDAVKVVSRLRNDEGVENARVYALSEVALTIRVEYRVEVPPETAAPPAAPSAVTLPVAPLSALPHPDPASLVEDQALSVPVEDGGAHLSVVRDEPVEVAVAEVPAARLGDVLPDEEPPVHGTHRARGIGFFSSKS
jgi:hypothetical protein